MSYKIIKQLNADEQEPTSSPEVEAAATTNEPVETPIMQKAEPVIDTTAHDDFDWSRDKRNVVAYSKDERAKYDSV